MNGDYVITSPYHYVINSGANMRCYVPLLALVSLLAHPALAALPDAPPDEEKPYEIVTTEGCAIAIPQGWHNIDKFAPQVIIYREGDGIGVPEKDESGEPIQIGITPEKIRTEKPLQEGARVLVAISGQVPSLQALTRPNLQKLTLSDGHEAALLIMEFMKDGRRHSLQMKLLTKDDQGNGYIAGAFIVAGKSSKYPDANSDLAKWLRAHLLTLVLDSSKMDLKPLEAAYKEKDKDKPKEQ